MPDKTTSAARSTDNIAVEMTLRGQTRTIGEPNWEAAEEVLDTVADIFESTPAVRREIARHRTGGSKWAPYLVGPCSTHGAHQGPLNFTTYLFT